MNDPNFLDFYEIPDDVERWITCPACNSKPRAWIFDNGRKATCRCSGHYVKPEASAPAIMAVLNETGSTATYDRDELRKNWNTRCALLQIQIEIAA